MDIFELFQRFSVALAIGLLIGIERGWHEREGDRGEGAAGLRTHALAAVLGGTWGAIALKTGDMGAVGLGLAFLAFTFTIALYRFRETQAEGTFGATTVVAAMLSFALGAYALVGDHQVAAAAGIAVTALLALKRVLHEWISRLTWNELRSALMLLAMSFIMLPVLPNRPVPEIAGLNPYEIWLMTVMIAVISFAGYIAVRMAGQERGIAITGIAAGLVSSTAVTITLARLAKENPGQASLATGGALLAGATMMARVTAVTGIFNTQLMWALLPPLLTASAVTVLGALVLMRKNRGSAGDAGELKLKNPFELSTVLKFGALLAAVMILTEFAKTNAGASGLIGLAAISGVADVDAITLSMSRQAGLDVAVHVAERAIGVAVAVNTVAKSVLAWMTGGRSPGLPMAIVALAAISAGGLVMALQAAH